MSFTLADIRQGIREVTSTPSTYQLTDTALDDLINKFLLYVFPDDMKIDKLKVPYIFYTLQNQVEYPFDLETYISLEPPFYINGMQMLYYQDQGLWIRDFQYQYNQSVMGLGDGIQTTFPNVVNPPPIVPKSVIVTDGVENLVDSLGNGVLIGSLGGTGTVDYTTGFLSATFFSAPLSGVDIRLTYAPLNNGKPRAMFYEPGGAIQFSPIPDQAYRIEGQAYIMPTAFIAGGSGFQTPELQYWGYVTIYGVSLEIFRRRGQLDQKAAYQPEYEKYLDLALSRTTQQSSNQRTVPKW